MSIPRSPAKTILLVEDEALIAMNEASMLEKRGFTVVIAYTAENAIEEARREEVDIILMDIDLGAGKMDGTEAARRILRERELPIVFCTSHAEKEYVDRVKKITGYGYVLKNAGEFVLVESIHMAFELFEAHQNLKEENEQRKKTEQQLSFQSMLLDQISDRITATDLQGRITYVNRAECRSFGKSVDELLGMHVQDYGEDPARGASQQEIVAATLEKGRWEGEVVNITAEGREIIFDARTQLIYDEKGEPTGMLGISTDITERKQAEAEISRSEERFRIISKLSSDYAYCNCLQEDGSLEPVWHVGSFAAISGYTPEELYELGGWGRLIHPDDLPAAGRYVDTLLSGKEATFTARIRTKSGGIRWIEDTGQPWIDEETGEVIGTFGAARDITKQKQSEIGLAHSHASMQTVLDAIPEDIYIADMETYEILFINTHMMHSFPRASVGDICYNAFRGNSRPCSHCTNNALLDEDGEPADVITSECYNPVNHRWYINYDRAISWFDDRYVKLQVAADISERKLYEEKLKAALRDKDFLMKELNHRVKNNLAMVSSLISLKDASLGDEIDLSDIARQTDAIKIVYEKLNQAEEVIRIGVEDYIRDLLENVFSFSRHTVEVVTNITVGELHTRIAVPVGLIINELATNAVKHGFRDDAAAWFEVTLERDSTAESYVLRVANSGRPFPDCIHLDNPDTLGLQLITALVQQLQGTVDLSREPHPVFTIRFPVEHPAG